VGVGSNANKESAVGEGVADTVGVSSTRGSSGTVAKAAAGDIKEGVAVGEAVEEIISTGETNIPCCGLVNASLL
jgi:hypothetical protein